MAEQAQSVSDTQQTSNEPTLDDVYKQYPVEQEANQFNPQNFQSQPAQPTAQPQTPMGTEIPDPVLDQAGFKAYLAKNAQEQAKALSTLTQTQQQIAAMEWRRREEADIQSAVSTIQSKVGDVDSDLIESFLNMKARKDSRFASIYQNRGKNPQAWNAAQMAVANELKGKTQFRTDPQLTENVRAAKQSTSTSLTTKDTGDAQTPVEKALAGAKTQAEFDQLWAQMRSGG
jgi:hypothetical protein